MNKERSNRADVRNPMLALPEVQAFAALPDDSRKALRDALNAFSKACRERGNECWRRHKPPMAAYWKANAVNARHLAKALNQTRDSVIAATGKEG